MHAEIERLRAAFAARQPMRAGSLIVTLFGDVIAPRGGAVLLPGLIGLLEHLRLNDSQVRTALSRLVADGWLQARRIGRQSEYRLTASGVHRVAEAGLRIYGGTPRDWNGRWDVAILATIPAEAREAVRRALQWLGFGALAPNLLIHPAVDRASLESLIADLAKGERPLLIGGVGADSEILGGTMAEWRRLVAECWSLEGVAADYHGFLQDFGPVAARRQAGAPAAGLEALLLRLMLIHDYRRLVLRDPLLPAALLPEGWIGGQARDLAAGLYRDLLPVSEAWIDRHLATAEAPLPPAGPGLADRFR